MIFEYDRDKSDINRSKHGIDFEKAQELWSDPYAFELPSLQAKDEERRRKSFMKASEIDKKFDDNQEDVLDYFDTSKIKMINEEPKRVNIDFPAWMISSLDKEARHIGVSRQAIIKMWLAEKLQNLNSQVAS